VLKGRRGEQDIEKGAERASDRYMKTGKAKMRK
jgi:hypothetical protein